MSTKCFTVPGCMIIFFFVYWTETTILKIFLFFGYAQKFDLGKTNGKVTQHGAVILVAFLRNFEAPSA